MCIRVCALEVRWLSKTHASEIEAQAGITRNLDPLGRKSQMSSAANMAARITWTSKTDSKSSSQSARAATATLWCFFLTMVMTRCLRRTLPPGDDGRGASTSFTRRGGSRSLPWSADQSAGRGTNSCRPGPAFTRPATLSMCATKALQKNLHIWKASRCQQNGSGGETCDIKAREIDVDRKHGKSCLWFLKVLRNPTTCRPDAGIRAVVQQMRAKRESCHQACAASCSRDFAWEDIMLPCKLPTSA
jgi:hypothetical protein